MTGATQQQVSAVATGGGSVTCRVQVAIWCAPSAIIPAYRSQPYRPSTLAMERSGLTEIFSTGTTFNPSTCRQSPPTAVSGPTPTGTPPMQRCGPKPRLANERLSQQLRSPSAGSQPPSVESELDRRVTIPTEHQSVGADNSGVDGGSAVSPLRHLRETRGG